MWLKYQLILTCCLSATALQADQIILTNGDKISGSIVKKDGGSLTVKSEFMGEVTMPWSAVASLQSDAPLHVVLPNGKDVEGKLSTENSGLAVNGATQTAPTPLGQVTTIRNPDEQRKYERILHPGWLDLWAGYADLGFALARGNARTTTLTTAFIADRVTNTDKTELFFKQIYSTARLNGVNASTADAARGGASYAHDLNRRLFYELQNTDEYDNFQGLDFRFVAGGGVGFHAIKTKRTLLDLLAGGDYAHEKFTTLTRNLGEVNGGDDFAFKLSSGTSLTQSFRIFDAPASSQYRINFDVGAATTIRKWLSWQVTASDRYLSNPILGRKGNDVLLTTGVRATFAR